MTLKNKQSHSKATNNIGKPIATVAGFAVGKYALKKLQKNQTVKGLMGTEMKDYLVPVAVTMGGLIGTQFTKNEYIKLGLVGAAGAGVEAAIKKATGKTILQGLEGVMGDEETEEMPLLEFSPMTQTLPAADLDIEKEIDDSVSGVEEDYAMSDEPVGTTHLEIEDDEEEEVASVGAIESIDPDSMDYDIFSGDMMES